VWFDAICAAEVNNDVPVTRCREQLEAFRTAGGDIPILMPPMGVEAARTLIQAFRR
jgi:hypothetical protein